MVQRAYTCCGSQIHWLDIVTDTSIVEALKAEHMEFFGSDGWKHSETEQVRCLGNAHVFAGAERPSLESLGPGAHDKL